MKFGFKRPSVFCCCCCFFFCFFLGKEVCFFFQILNLSDLGQRSVNDIGLSEIAMYTFI